MPWPGMTSGDDFIPSTPADFEAPLHECRRSESAQRSQGNISNTGRGTTQRMAGYSGTPLARKLGIKAGHVVAALRAPARFYDDLAPLPEGVLYKTNATGSKPFDVIVDFCKLESEVVAAFADRVPRLQQAGGLWIAWPKKTSGVATELGDGAVRAIGLEAGLVDNKICAIDETWSALRFVRRLVDRK